MVISLMYYKTKASELFSEIVQKMFVDNKNANIFAAAFKRRLSSFKSL